MLNIGNGMLLHHKSFSVYSVKQIAYHSARFLFHFIDNPVVLLQGQAAAYKLDESSPD